MASVFSVLICVPSSRLLIDSVDTSPSHWISCDLLLAAMYSAALLLVATVRIRFDSYNIGLFPMYIMLDIVDFMLSVHPETSESLSSLSCVLYFLYTCP